MLKSPTARTVLAVVLFPVALALVVVLQTLVLGFLLWLSPTPQRFVLNFLTDGTALFIMLFVVVIACTAVQVFYAAITTRWATLVLLIYHAASAVFYWFRLATGFHAPPAIIATKYMVFLTSLLYLASVGGLLYGRTQVKPVE